MTAVYSFEAQLQAGEQQEARVFSWLESHGYAPRLATADEQRHGIDLWTQTKTALAVEIKADFLSESTGNFALELVSVLPAKPGWVFTSRADRFFLLQPSAGRVVSVASSDLRARLRSWLTIHKIKAALNREYVSLVLLVPVSTVTAIGKAFDLGDA